MTDITALDAEIVKAAKELVGAYGQHGPWEQQHIERLRKAIAARAAADKPKPLDVEGAKRAYDDATGLHRMTWNNSADRGFQAVLDAAAERWLKVIEAIPAESISHMGSPVVHWIKREDIRSALKPGGQ